MDRHHRPRRPVRRDLHRLPDRLHADRRRDVFRVCRARRPLALPDATAVLLRHARSDARVGAVFPFHGLPARAIGPDGAAIPRRAAPVRVVARLAVSRRADNRDDLRGGDRHRRLVGHVAGRNGSAGDEAQRLRRAHVRGRHHGRRNARHSDPAIGDADRHGTGRSAILSIPFYISNNFAPSKKYKNFPFTGRFQICSTARVYSDICFS